MSYYPNCYNEDPCCFPRDCYRPSPIQECCNFPQPQVIVVGIIGYGSFYFTTPTTPATVAPGSAFSFPLQTVVPSGGIARQGGTSTTTFTLAVPGIYEFSWQITTSEGLVQIAINLGSTVHAATIVGKSTALDQLSNTILLPVTAPGTTVQLVVPLGSANSATPVTTGGTNPITGNFVIKRISTNTF